MVKQSEDKALSQLLKKHKDFAQTQNGKIRCEITSHEMSNVKEFKEYLAGRAYKRALESNFDKADFSEYLDAHFTNPKLLFCRLTGEKVVNKRSVVEKHVKGKRYARALKKLQDDEQKKLERENEKKERIAKRKSEREAKSKEDGKEEKEMEEEVHDEEEVEEEEEEQPEQKPSKKAKTSSIHKHKKITKPATKPKPSKQQKPARKASKAK